MGRVIVYAAGGVLAVVVLIAAAAGGVAAAIFGTSGQDPGCAAATPTTTNPARGSRPEDLSPEQARNAAVIVAVGQRMKVPVRGWVIAIATALQESDLINSGTATDHDSLGLAG